MTFPTEGDDPQLCERSVLGALLLHADALADVADLRADDFAEPRHRTIFRAAVQSHADTGATDPIAVDEVLRSRGMLADVGGINYLFDLLESVVTAAGIAGHAEILRRRSHERRVLDLAQRIAESAKHGDNVANAAAALADLTARGSNSKRQILEGFTLADLAAMPPRKFIVDGIGHEDSQMVLCGPPKSYKTVLGDALCVAVADGGTWLDRKVTASGLVIDCALEGMMGKHARYQAHIGAARFQDPDDPIHRRLVLLRTIPDVTTTAGQDLLLRTIDHYVERFREPLRVLKVDTLARGLASAGLDENATQDMGAFLSGLDRVRIKHPCLQVIVHHTGKNGTERGSSALLGAVDAFLMVQKTMPTEAKVWVKAGRDIETPAPWIVGFAPVVVGEHENGRHITAMRVDWVRVDADQAGPSKTTCESAVLAVLVSAGVEGCTRAKIEQVLAGTYKPNTIWDALNKLCKTSKAVPRGKHPIRYWTTENAPTSGEHPDNIRPEIDPDNATETKIQTKIRLSGRPLKGAGPDLRPDVGGPAERFESAASRTGGVA